MFLHGVFPPITTPFYPDGSIYHRKLEQNVEHYSRTPTAGVVAAAKPTIMATSLSLKIGSVNNVLYGKQLNGLSQNNAYGDDYQGDTDFPLVRFTCLSGGCTVGNVSYAFTHDDSTHSIAPGTIMYTNFDIPSTTPAGIYQMNAVTNGIPSNTVVVKLH